MYTDMGPSSLQFSDIVSYAEILGYKDSNSLIFFVKVMQACDSVYLSIVTKRRKAELEAQKAEAKRRQSWRKG